MDEKRKLTEEAMAAYDAERLGVAMDWTIDMLNWDAESEEQEEEPDDGR